MKIKQLRQSLSLFLAKRSFTRLWSLLISATLWLMTPLWANAQNAVYILKTDASFYRFSNGTLTPLATAPQGSGNKDNMIYVAPYIYQGLSGDVLKRYDPATDTWNSLSSPPVSSMSFTTNGTDKIYSLDLSGVMNTYDIASDTWTTGSNPIPLNPDECFATAYHNGFVYIQTFSGTDLAEYSIDTDTWSIVNSSGIGGDISQMVAVGSNLYTISPVTNILYRYNFAINTWYDYLTVPFGASAAISTDGSFLYVHNIAGESYIKVDLETATFTTINTSVGSTVYNIAAGPPVATPCTTPTNVFAMAQAATCSVSGVNTDGKLVLTAHTSGDKVGYSAGTTYTGPAYASATAIGTLPFTVASGLANPTAPADAYTLRVFGGCDAQYTDITVYMQRTTCGNLSVSISPTTATANVGENVTYTLTLTNAGPHTANNVKLRVPIHPNGTLLVATPSQGTFSEGTTTWEVGDVAVGSQTLTFTLQVK